MDNEEYQNEEFNVDDIEKELQSQLQVDTAKHLGEFIGVFYKNIIDKGVPEELAEKMVNTLFYSIIKGAISKGKK
ncbi:MAG: hypothetical protein ACOC1K_01145 [Nanoarchaeota archaeon]